MLLPETLIGHKTNLNTNRQVTINSSNLNTVHTGRLPQTNLAQSDCFLVSRERGMFAGVIPIPLCLATPTLYITQLSVSNGNLRGS